MVCYIDSLNDDYMPLLKFNTIFLIALLIMILCMYFIYIIICLLSKQYSVVEKYEDKEVTEKVLWIGMDVGNNVLERHINLY